MTQLVPAGSTFDIYFPKEYLILTNNSQPPLCDSVIINDIPVSNTLAVQQTGVPGNYILKISGAIATNTAISTSIITISGIINVSPAITTSPFVIKIGNDYSANSSSAAITFQPAAFLGCGINFNPSQVNTTGSMIVTLVLAN